MLSKHLTFKSKVWSRPELCTIFSFRNWLETGSHFSSYIVDMPLCILEYSVKRPSNLDALFIGKYCWYQEKKNGFIVMWEVWENLKGKNKVSSLQLL